MRKALLPLHAPILKLSQHLLFSSINIIEKMSGFIIQELIYPPQSEKAFFYTKKQSFPTEENSVFCFERKIIFFDNCSLSHQKIPLAAVAVVDVVVFPDFIVVVRTLKTKTIYAEDATIF